MTAAPKISISFLKMKLKRCFVVEWNNTYCGDGQSLFVCYFFGKNEERILKQKHDISDGLFGTTGMYQKCLSNIHI